MNGLVHAAGYGVLGLAVAASLFGCRPLPPSPPIPVPRLALGSTMRAGVLRAYGQPRQKTADSLWYVGPKSDSLLHGADGWMTLLTFDNAACLRSQEYLRRYAEQGYIRADYWINGWIAGRSRDSDFDRLMIARCIELAGQSPDYRVTMNQPDSFVLARLLPSQNEPVVQWQVIPASRDDRSGISITVRALVGRDEPLIEKLDGAVGLRMLLIEIPRDAESGAGRASGFGAGHSESGP